MKFKALLIVHLLIIATVKGQLSSSFTHVQPNVITTAVPFLTINTNAQSFGFGCVGVVASDLYTQNGLDQNPALLARGKRVAGFQLINYAPWLRNFVPDVNIMETGYYHSISNKTTLGVSGRYFSLGEVQFTDDFGNNLGTFRPYEFATGLKIAHNFSKNFSVGVGLKYIYSDLAGGITLGNGQKVHPAQALAADIGFDYRTFIIENENFTVRWNLGISILNLGNKVTYTDNENRDFIPQTLKIGSMLTFKWELAKNDHFAIDLAYQADKLLVPTPPIFVRDSLGNLISIGKGGHLIKQGMNSNVNSLQGAVQSFYDAPGGFTEEMSEIIHQFGTEARYCTLNKKFLLAFRYGYFLEHELKGNRKFNTFGLGIGIEGCRLDLAYILSPNQRHPLQNTVIMSLGAKFNLDEKRFLAFKE